MKRPVRSILDTHMGLFNIKPIRDFDANACMPLGVYAQYEKSKLTERLKEDAQECFLRPGTCTNLFPLPPYVRDIHAQSGIRHAS